MHRTITMQQLIHTNRKIFTLRIPIKPGNNKIIPHSSLSAFHTEYFNFYDKVIVNTGDCSDCKY